MLTEVRSMITVPGLIGPIAADDHPAPHYNLG